jgi:hypothetical protein
MGMLEPRGYLDLAREALGAERRGQLGTQDLYRYPPVVFQILGEIDGRHAALAELPLDAVAVGEGFPQSGYRLGHRGLGCGMRGRWRERSGRASAAPST